MIPADFEFTTLIDGTVESSVGCCIGNGDVVAASNPDDLRCRGICMGLCRAFCDVVGFRTLMRLRVEMGNRVHS